MTVKADPDEEEDGSLSKNDLCSTLNSQMAAAGNFRLVSSCIRVKYGLQVTFYLPKYCKKVPIYCIKIQVKSWFVAINTSTEK